LPSTAKPRLLIIAAVNPTGLFGSQFLVRQHFDMFKKAGNTIRLTTPKCHGEFKRNGQIDEQSGPSLRKIADLRKLLASSEQAIEEFKPDLILAHNYEAGLIAKSLKRRTSIPIIYIPHGLLEKELPTYYSNPIKKRIFPIVGKILDRRIFRNVDYVVTLTEPLREYIGRKYKFNHISAISPPFEPMGCPESIKIPRDLDAIFYSGNPYGYQNFESLIDVIRAVRKRNSNSKLIIAANPPKHKWQKILTNLKKAIRCEIHYPKTLAETMALASRAGLAVVPRVDPFGFPMKIHLYVNCRLPMVAYDCGWPGLVDGETALLASPGNARELAERILELPRDEKLGIALSSNAYEKFAKNYCATHISHKFHEIFNKL